MFRTVIIIIITIVIIITTVTANGDYLLRSPKPLVVVV